MDFQLTSDVNLSMGLMEPVSQEVCNNHIMPHQLLPYWDLSIMSSSLQDGCIKQLNWFCICLNLSMQGACEWSPHRKQGVYFLKSPWESSGDGRAAVSYDLTFDPSLGDIKMDFSIASP